jgi:uncharacterized repeat protein (TIGR03803 family)
MKKCLKTAFLLPMAIAALSSVLIVQARTLTTLHTFIDGTPNPNALLLSGSTLYGTTWSGGAPGLFGTVFSINVDGSGFTNLHTFTAAEYYTTNSDGSQPSTGLTLSSNTLYGTAFYGGSSGNGTVFAVHTDGIGFTVLHNFAGPLTSGNSVTNSDGAWPDSGLVISGNTLFGTAQTGGTCGNGTLFKVNTDGSGFTNIYNFTSESASNTDGGRPATLLLSGSTLYGTTSTGGSGGVGTVFAVNTDGIGFLILHSFAPEAKSSQGIATNSDGANPSGGGLVLSGNTVYGTTTWGGSWGDGTLFAVNTDGSGFENLHVFDALYLFGSFTTNIGGANPVAGLVPWGKTLYGLGQYGGDFSDGTLFAVNTDGTDFTTLYDFHATLQFEQPVALLLSGYTIYGATAGFYGNGTIFSMSLLPQLAITAVGESIVLTWPTNYAGFDYTGFNLQFTTNLSSPVWATNSAAPLVVNGQNTVTNPISGTHEFFRLSQ